MSRSLVVVILCALLCPALHAQDSSGRTESERLKKLEDAVRQLHERNAELEGEVRHLKANRGPMAPILAGPERKATAGNDNKAVFAAPSPPPVYAVAGGSEYKLTLGGYIQANLESGDVSAFEGRFGTAALRDRFRLRRARITLTGDFAEQFDVRIEGDLAQSDGASPSTRTVFSGTDISSTGTTLRKRI
jgi:hypothetical protein